MPRRLAPLTLALLLAACGDGEPLLPPDAVLPDGGRYRGEVIDGRLQGEGRIDYANGTYYQGRFKDGLLEGLGEWHGASGERYKGEFHLGLFEGQGEFVYGEGTRYQGGFRQGNMHGEGHLQQGGVSYRGEFRDDRYHGLGTLEWPDGSRYQGRFVRGEPQGEGVRKNAEGQFSGTFKNGMLQGEGSYQGEDGERYSGEFRNDMFHGKGRYQNGEGEVWSGRFKDGGLTGKGEFRGADGRHYEGEFRHWQFHGQGKLSLADGSVYQGQFANGQYAGTGELTALDGSRTAGTWRGGELIRQADGAARPDPLELGLLQQGQLLQQALDALPASTPAVELYSLTLAGDGKQSVFLREADYVSKLLRERFGARGNITLTNHRDHLADRPLATRESLTRAVQALAERSGPEDLVFLYLTSHGSRDHQLSIDQPRLQLADLPANELAALLAPLKDRHKVVVISACYSGGFIPPLKNDKTLVMTAARADRVSFGCSEENDFTYFGRALFADALNETDDLNRAFELAKAKVAEREEADDFEPSEPQLWAPRAVVEHWKKLRTQQAEQALTAATKAH
ncbi:MULTISPECIES: C13 family peptidase [unclassified Pseudomonas]|uniref:C13 family peptidase n=1 Tax=unclassified Pseudomonas TaxID=196821 RepID=UPI0024499A42|nr:MULTISPECIES: C13 family peptidase [unclassified Pseudomonas]MDG9925558.1 caspase family protein [Pseudomonas sp. GD04045]MDH0035826.1 caspase family protein [Pseudomonas sp. GD04019]